MLMATKTSRWTRFDLERFPEDGNRYEVLDGELLVTPQSSPRHQQVAMELAGALYEYCKEHEAGAIVGPAAVIFGENELQPDIEILPFGAIRPKAKWEKLPCPLLVVEVLSPFAASRRRDLDVKRVAYLRLGVPEYWVVDHEKRLVHVWSGGRAVKIVTDVLRWNPDSAVIPFERSLEELFGPLER
jgi:Uma2 family endonuclease